MPVQPRLPDQDAGPVPEALGDLRDPVADLRDGPCVVVSEAPLTPVGAR